MGLGFQPISSGITLPSITIHDYTDFFPPKILADVIKEVKAFDMCINSLPLNMTLAIMERLNDKYRVNQTEWAPRIRAIYKDMKKEQKINEEGAN